MTDADQRLHAMIRNRRLPHGLLLSGHRPQELLAAALSVAKHLVCGVDPEQRPCGRCNACVRTDESQHPDVLVLSPEKQELTMEQIRSALGWIARGPFEAPSKIAIFRQAETLNASSSNALLKTLEEPPSHAVLILLTHSPDSLLPTVRSRLAHIRFFSPDEGDETAPGEQPDWHEDLVALLARKDPPPSRKIFELTEQISRDRSGLSHFFSAFTKHVKDRLKTAAGQPAQSALVRHLEFTFDRALRAEQDILHHYGNVSVALDHLLVSYFSRVH